MGRLLQRIRSLAISWSCTGMAWATSGWFFENPPGTDITWRNRLGWWIEGQFERFFNWAYPGSDEEIELAWDIPLPDLSARQLEFVWPAFDEHEAYCYGCHWTGSAYDLQFSEGYHFCCPECFDTSTHLDVHGTTAPWCREVRARRAAKGGA